MKQYLFLAAFVAALLVTPAAVAAPPTGKTNTTASTKKAKESATPRYECPDCHKTFSLAQAKKEGMKCSCCQAKLIGLKSKPAKKVRG